MTNNKVQQIKDYLEQYKKLDDYWKNLLSSTYEYYQKKLMLEYSMLEVHPYPEEYNMYSYPDDHRKHYNVINRGSIV